MDSEFVYCFTSMNLYPFFDRFSDSEEHWVQQQLSIIRNSYDNVPFGLVIYFL